jgi:hypothetical protein
MDPYGMNAELAYCPETYVPRDEWEQGYEQSGYWGSKPGYAFFGNCYDRSTKAWQGGDIAQPDGDSDYRYDGNMKGPDKITETVTGPNALSPGTPYVLVSDEMNTKNKSYPYGPRRSSHQDESSDEPPKDLIKAGLGYIYMPRGGNVGYMNGSVQWLTWEGIDKGLYQRGGRYHFAWEK